MPSLDAVRQSNAAFSPHTTPVAIFLGGTSGIGQGTAQAFARATKGNAHIIIIGRNRAAAEATFKTLPTHANSKYEFVSCDVSLLRNVAAVTPTLLARLPKVNYVVLTCGALPSLWDSLRGVTRVTEEGVNAGLELPYYARIKFLLDTLPLLQKAKDAGEDARVLTVAIAGFGGPINYDDMGLLKTHSAKTFRPTLATYTDAAMEVRLCVIGSPDHALLTACLQVLAARAPGVTFAHACPGTVDTPLFPWWIRPLTRFMFTSPVDAGEYMLYALLNGGEGAQRKSPHGDDLPPESYYGGDDVREKVWSHTMEVIEKAEAAAA